MKGGVYKHRAGYRVYFRGQWFHKDEHGRPFRAEFYAWAFLEHLNALYDPDPAKNRYDPSRFKDKTPYKFDEAFELYLDRRQTDSGWHRAKEWTWKKYFQPFFANQDFRTIDQVQLEGFQKWLKEKNLQGKSIKNVMGILHGFLTHFKSTLNFFPTFPAINYQQKRIKWFTEKELDEVFEFINEQDRGYFLFIRYYGVRPEEASGLLRNAVNWETRQIIISSVYVDGKVKARTKTNRERVLPIIPEIEPYLNSSGLSTFVFHIDSHPYSRHIRERRWNKAMRQAIKKYATRPMTLRDLRTSAGSRWRKAGMPIEDISQLLGHSKIEMTKERYADQAQDNLVPIMRGINERK